jgi:hypothetical protein
MAFSKNGFFFRFPPVFPTFRGFRAGRPPNKGGEGIGYNSCGPWL